MDQSKANNSMSFDGVDPGHNTYAIVNLTNELQSFRAWSSKPIFFIHITLLGHQDGLLTYYFFIVHIYPKERMLHHK